MAYGMTFGEFEVEHPQTFEPLVVHVRIDYSENDDTYDTPGAFDWTYKIEWVENYNKEIINDTPWLTHKMMEKGLDDLLANI
jgi:hypothetical protein